MGRKWTPEKPEQLFTHQHQQWPIAPIAAIKGLEASQRTVSGGVPKCGYTLHCTPDTTADMYTTSHSALTYTLVLGSAGSGGGGVVCSVYAADCTGSIQSQHPHN